MLENQARTRGPGWPADDTFLSFNLPSNPTAAPVSTPPIEQGGANKPPRQNSVKAGAVTGFLAQIPAVRERGVTGETARFLPLEWGAA